MPTIIQLAHEITPLQFVRIEALLNKTRRYDPDWNGAEFVIQMGDYTCIRGADEIKGAQLLNAIQHAITGYEEGSDHA